jgi:formylglycine-generating enzyme required for sulfatase activity
VPGGTFYRTYANSGTGPTGEADPATVSGFRLDKYLVTVGRFYQFKAALDATSPYAPANGSGKQAHLNNGNGLNATGGGNETGWDATDWDQYVGNTVTTGANLNCPSSYMGSAASASTATDKLVLPINCVTWYEAYAFCIWDGGFLPSEAEWGYAAAGGSQQREYPWGTTAPGTANQYAIYNFYYTVNSTYVAPVGTATLGAGQWLQLDLAGNVFEWNLDWYTTYADPCTDCADLATASNRVIRGGSFDYNTPIMLPPNRDDRPPTDREVNVGFRCARTP